MLTIKTKTQANNALRSVIKGFSDARENASALAHVAIADPANYAGFAANLLTATAHAKAPYHSQLAYVFRHWLPNAIEHDGEGNYTLKGARKDFRRPEGETMPTADTIMEWRMMGEKERKEQTKAKTAKTRADKAATVERTMAELAHKAAAADSLAKDKADMESKLKAARADLRKARQAKGVPELEAELAKAQDIAIKCGVALNARDATIHAMQSQLDQARESLEQLQAAGKQQQEYLSMAIAERDRYKTEVIALRQALSQAQAVALQEAA